MTFVMANMPLGTYSVDLDVVASAVNSGVFWRTLTVDRYNNG